MYARYSIHTTKFTLIAHKYTITRANFHNAQNPFIAHNTTHERSQFTKSLLEYTGDYTNRHSSHKIKYHTKVFTTKRTTYYTSKILYSLRNTIIAFIIESSEERFLLGESSFFFTELFVGFSNESRPRTSLFELTDTSFANRHSTLAHV